jgi:uncharacterized protein YkwD
MRTRAVALVVIAAVAVIGCGGGSKPESGPPSGKSAKNPGGVVSAAPPRGIVGPVERVVAGGRSQASDIRTRLSPQANRPVKVHEHGVAGAADCPDAALEPAGDNLDRVSASILCLVNAARAENGGLPALKANAQLQQAAAGMANRMVSEKFFSHETPDGKTVVDRVEPTGYIPDSGDWAVGENLAWGDPGVDTPQAVVNGWLNSAGHRANMLAPDYKDLGLAEALGAPVSNKSGGTTVVADFGAQSGGNPDFVLPAKDSSNDDGTGDGDGDGQPDGGPDQAPIGKVSQAADGTLTLTPAPGSEGVLVVVASFGNGAQAASTKVSKGRRLFARLTKPVNSGKVVVKLKPTKTAKRALAKRKKLLVKIVSRFTPKAGTPTTVTRTVTVTRKR